MKKTKTINIVPHVSFIVPTLNCAPILNRCLHAVRIQHYPQNKIEIIVADGGSTDDTLDIAKKYGATIIHNSRVFQEPGKTLGSAIASGELLFYLDSDNILASPDWLATIIKPYQQESQIAALLPQTVPPPDSNTLDRYLGYLFTDPFTSFVYQNAANPLYYESLYQPVKKTEDYIVYIFPKHLYPLFGYAQGVGVQKKYAHGSFDGKDDMLSGIEVMKRGGRVAYVPNAHVYHYHVSDIHKFIRKYTWRTRNNLYQEKRDIGLRNRSRYLTPAQKIRAILFVPYAFSLILPSIDAIRLGIIYRNAVMLWHLPACIILATIICKETFLYVVGFPMKVGNYE